jgi:tol-pal system protein YbgF
MTISRPCIRIAALAALPALLLASAALAQERSGGLLDNLFGQQQQQPQPQPQQQQQAQQQPPQGQFPPEGGVEARIDRIENALRQLTGTVEELQHQNQMLQMQLKRMQDDTEYRFQQLGARGAAPTAPAVAPAPGNMPAANVAPAPGQHGDAFNPALHPGAPGAPRPLAGEVPGGPPPGQPIASAPPIGAPGGREPGAPLDLNSLAGTPPAPAPTAAPSVPPGGPLPPVGQLPPPPPRNTSATGTQLATLPPSGRPRDEYDLAYGYVLTKNYALATQAFRDFMHRYPNEKLVAQAQYWLGESLFQQQHYRDAAESFLAVSTKYEHSAKAPEALLRLGQSLAAMHKKEAACATLAEVGRKYPRAPSSVKRTVAQEQKRTHC